MGSRTPGRIARLIVALGAVAALAACQTGTATTSAPTPAHRPVPSATPVRPSTAPAAMAGGACMLMDYKVINSALATSFDVAASADKSGTYTCVIEGSHSLPDLTLAVTATSLTPADFTAHVAPKGSSSVSKLGLVGYKTTVKATSSAGAGLEIGWLSGNDRLIQLRYTGAVGSSVPSTLSDGMTSLARTVEATTV